MTTAYAIAYEQTRRDKQCGKSWIPDDWECTKSTSKAKSAKPFTLKKLRKSELSKNEVTLPKGSSLGKKLAVGAAVAATAAATATAGTIGMSAAAYATVRDNYRSKFPESAKQAQEQAKNITVEPLRDQAHTILFGLGGFTQGEGANDTLSGTRMANGARKAFSRHSKGKDIKAIPIANVSNGMDLEGAESTGNIDTVISAIKLHTNNLGGNEQNEASVNLAAHVIAYADKYPDRQIVMMGHSYGGSVLFEAEELLRIARPKIEDRLKSVAFGTQWGGMTNSFGRSITVGSKNDFFTQAMPTRNLRKVDSVKGHFMGDYIDDPNVIELVQNHIYDGVDVEAFKPKPPQKSQKSKRDRKASREYFHDKQRQQYGGRTLSQTIKDRRRARRQQNTDSAYLDAYWQIRLDKACGNSYIPDDAVCTKSTKQGRRKRSPFATQRVAGPVRISQRKKPEVKQIDNRPPIKRILGGLALVGVAGLGTAMAVDAVSRKQRTREVKQAQDDSAQKIENYRAKLDEEYVAKTQELEKQSKAELKKGKDQNKQALEKKLDRERTKLQKEADKKYQDYQAQVTSEYQIKLADELVKAKEEIHREAEIANQPQARRGGDIARENDVISLRSSVARENGVELNFSDNPKQSGLTSTDLKKRYRLPVGEAVNYQTREADLRLARDFQDHVKKVYKKTEKSQRMPSWKTFAGDMTIQQNRETGLRIQADQLRKAAYQYHDGLIDGLYDNVRNQPERQDYFLKKFDQDSKAHLAEVAKALEKYRTDLYSSQRYSTDAADGFASHHVNTLGDVDPLADVYALAYASVRNDKRCGNSWIPDDEECHIDDKPRRRKLFGLVGMSELMGTAGALGTAYLVNKAYNSNKNAKYKEMANAYAAGYEEARKDACCSECDEIEAKPPQGLMAQMLMSNTAIAVSQSLSDRYDSMPTTLIDQAIGLQTYEAFREDAPKCDPRVSKPCGDTCIPKNYDCEIDDGLSNLSIRDLKEEARGLSISNYSLMNKSQLVNSIRTVQQGPMQQARLEKTLEKRRRSREAAPLKEVARIVRKRRQLSGLKGIEAAIASATAVTAIGVFAVSELKGRYRGRFGESAEAAKSQGEGVKVEKLSRNTKHVTFAVDGFTSKGTENQGGVLAESLKRNDPDGFGSDKHHIIPISGPEFNEIEGSKVGGPIGDAVENFQKAARVLDTSLLEGRNPKSIELAAQVYAYHNSYNVQGKDERNRKQINLIGDHAGGNVVNEAVEILRVMDGTKKPKDRIADNLHVVNLGTNSWGLTEPVAKTDEKKGTTGRTLTLFSKDDSVFLFPKRRPQHVHSIKGSTTEDYLSNPEAMGMIKGVVETETHGRTIPKPKTKAEKKAAKKNAPYKAPDFIEMDWELNGKPDPVTKIPYAVHPANFPGFQAMDPAAQIKAMDQYEKDLRKRNKALEEYDKKAKGIAEQLGFIYPDEKETDD